MTVKQIGTKTIDLTKSILLELKQVTKTEAKWKSHYDLCESRKSPYNGWVLKNMRLVLALLGLAGFTLKP